MTRSVLAVLAGLLFIVATHLGMDFLMREAGVFPMNGEPMTEPSLYLLAFSYRSLFSIAGCYVAAALASRAPFEHATALGIVGTVFSGLGVVAAVQSDMGPIWYPLALLVSCIPCAWAGGWLHTRLNQQPS